MLSKLSAYTYSTDLATTWNKVNEGLWSWQSLCVPWGRVFRYNSECIPDLFGINYVTILLLSLVWNFELKSLYSVITMMIRRDRKPKR